MAGPGLLRSLEPPRQCALLGWPGNAALRLYTRPGLSACLTAARPQRGEQAARAVPGAGAAVAVFAALRGNSDSYSAVAG